MGRAQGRDSAVGAARRGSQVPKPIARMLTLDPQFNPYSQLIRQLKDGSIDTDPPYQRGHVWGEERQVALIKSVTMGLPSGNLFLNRRSWDSPAVVVDGKQRLRAVERWVDGELAVPSHWFEPGMLSENAGETVTFDQLSAQGQRGWQNYAATQVYYTSFDGPDAEERERELFELINDGGVQQGASDFEQD